jgi:lysosomal-associated transmembrane protein
VFALTILRPDLLPKYPEQIFEDVDNFSYGNPEWVQRKWTSEDKFVGLLFTISYFVITIMLIYGAGKGRAGYLMPFFCMQVFDFCLTCLSFVSYFSYIPNIKRWIQAQGDFPWKQELLQLNDDWLMLAVVSGFVMVITMKAYLIGIVWACYKYLTGYERAVARGIHRAYSNMEIENPEDTEMLLPPKYEDVLRMTAEEPAPPPYCPAQDDQEEEQGATARPLAELRQ